MPPRAPAEASPNPGASALPAPQRPVAASATFVLASLSASVALLAASCALYPGGSWVDRRAAGHSFCNNLLCDLVQPTALDGTPNPLGSRLAQAAMFTLILAAGAHWTLASHLLRTQRRLARVVRGAGLCATVAAVAIPLTPSQRYGEIHTLAVLLAAMPTLLAGAGAVLGFARGGAAVRAEYKLGALAFALCVLDVLACARQITTGAPITTQFALLQRGALFGLFAWFVPTALRALRGGVSSA